MIQHRHGFSFAFPIVIVSVVITIAGIVEINENPILGIGLTLFCAFFWSSSYGVQIDISSQRLREYTSMYGIKKGNWKPLNNLPYITVIKSKSGMKTYSRSNRSTSYIEDMYEVCLLSENHRQKVPVKKFDTIEDAKSYSQDLAKELNKNIVVYKPSQNSKIRS